MKRVGIVFSATSKRYKNGKVSVFLHREIEIKPK
jgi:hypothetical protein